MAVLANVSYWVTSLGATGEVGGWKSGRGSAAAAEEYLLDADGVGVGSSNEGIHAGAFAVPNFVKRMLEV